MRYSYAELRTRRGWLRRVAAEYRAGATLVELARRHGPSATMLRRLLLEHGVVMRPTGGKRVRARYAALRARGWTLAAIGRKYGVTRQAVRQGLLSGRGGV